MKPVCSVLKAQPFAFSSILNFSHKNGTKSQRLMSKVGRVLDHLALGTPFKVEHELASW